MKPVLRIFVSEHCPGCDKVQNILDHINRNYPNSLVIEVVDIADRQASVPDRVFATPTYMLNDRIVSLGTPDPKEIFQWVAEAITCKV